MDRAAPDFSQPSLQSPFPAVAASEADGPATNAAPPAPAPPPQTPTSAHYPGAAEVRPSSFSPSATPTSDYGLNPPSARSNTFPEYVSRQPYPDGAPRYQQPPPGGPSAGSASMAQASSLPLPYADSSPIVPGRMGGIARSERDLSLDPSIAATSPTYSSPPSYSPYPHQHEMTSPYSPHHPAAAYGRPEWAPYSQQPHPHALPPTYSGHPSSPISVSAGSPVTAVSQRPHQVYSFVPIPGAQQHKRPRRRYEEIERMYKCGWKGCEKAYGTLNHLNAHVTMQSHGAKRTPDEFKEIRKEWKARKKDGESQRKAEEERQRAAAAPGGHVEPSPNGADSAQTSPVSSYASGVRPQLPPIGYAPSQGAPVQQSHYPPVNGIDQLQSYSNNSMYSNYAPAPYAQGGQVYQQRQSPPVPGPVDSRG